jgi:capsular exopolysaccharide synthesis family protein
VTSPGPGEGKSITVANLAVAMAQSGLEVVAVDADLRRPRLRELFGVRRGGGLTGSLLEGAVDGRLREVKAAKGLSVLPAGKLPPNPAELLSSRRMHDLLDLLAGQADVVLVDSPPVLSVTDAAVLARSVDGVLLVMGAGETRREAARRAVESLGRVGGNLVGVVLNRVPTRQGSYYYRYYREDGGNGRKQRKRTRDRRQRDGRKLGRRSSRRVTGRAKGASAGRRKAS